MDSLIFEWGISLIGNIRKVFPKLSLKLGYEESDSLYIVEVDNRDIYKSESFQEMSREATREFLARFRGHNFLIINPVESTPIQNPLYVSGGSRHTMSFIASAHPVAQFVCGFIQEVHPEQKLFAHSAIQVLDVREGKMYAEFRARPHFTLSIKSEIGLLDMLRSPKLIVGIRDCSKSKTASIAVTQSLLDDKIAISYTAKDLPEIRLAKRYKKKNIAFPDYSLN